MIGFFRGLGRVLGWLLRTRALRPVFAFAVFVWLFDGLVTTATDAAWFSSVGMDSLWREQFMWSTSVGAIFVVLGLVTGIPLMRTVARPIVNAPEEPALPRSLARWQTLRARATRVGWLCIAGAAIVLGHGLSLRWSEFALATSSSTFSSDGGPNFWMLRAPALQSLLAAVWAFTLVLGAVGLGAGLLRALPFLAARPSTKPLRWLRALSGVAVGLCVLRALGFAFEAMRHAQIANDSGAARVGFVLFNVLGALGCGAIIVLLRRPRGTLLLFVAAVLVLPGLGSDLLSPLVGRSSLAAPTPASLDAVQGVPTDWPQWDEVTLLRAARLRRAWDKQRHLIEWQRAGISGGGNRAEFVGTPILTDEWAGHGLTDREGEIAWESVELPEQRGVRQGRPLGPLFYGLKARPLLSMDRREIGAPFQSWLWKMAWAWRLRDPLLMVEGARANRLLAVRGAREVGQKLAPFWTWDDVVPRRNPRTGDAYFECVAYSSSARLPRRAAFENGVFAGQNSVTPVAVLRLDAHSGEIRVMPFANPGSLPLIARWKKVLPSLFGSNAPEFAPTPALEVALAGGSSLVWMRTAKGWQKKAVPLDMRKALGEKLDEFADNARSNSPVRLEGATPLIWRQGKELFLAQAFFDFAANNAERSATIPEKLSLPAVTGVIAGPLEKRLARWSATFAGARAALSSPVLANGNIAPVPSADGDARPLRDIAREAQRAEEAASNALKMGGYVEAQKQRARLKVLLEELARRAR